MVEKESFLSSLYEKIESWAQSPNATRILFLLSFVESIFFPIPPDVLLIAIAVARPKLSFRLASITLIGSLVGGAIGYAIGYFAMDHIGWKIIHGLHLESGFETFKTYYSNYGEWIVAVFGFTPIPYKVVTLSSGAFQLSFPIFLFASAVSRGARFFLVAGLMYKFGPTAQPFIKKYFNYITITIVIGVGLGFWILSII